MEVICQYCKSQANKVEKEKAIRIDEKNFHPACASKYVDRKELTETICRIFKFKAPGPRNNAYITKFLNEGMTLKGMTNSLIYFYEIKKNSIEKSNNGIGIIPWVYEEAQQYFNKKEKMEKEMREAIEFNKNNKEEIKEETRKVRVQEVRESSIKIQTYSENEFEW